MRMLALIVVLLHPVVNAVGQSVDYNKIILPDGASDVSFEERLVQLAWRNNPSSRIVQVSVDQVREESKVTRRTWSTLAGVTFNFNEFNVARFTNSEPSTNQFYPRYNIFFQLPLSLVVQAPHIKQVGKSKMIIAQEQVNLTKIGIRSRVLKLYSEYKKSETVLALRKQSASDDESNYLLIEQKFKNGEVLVEDYLKAQRMRNDLKIEMAISENEFRQAKLDLEEMIGVKIEDVK